MSIKVPTILIILLAVAVVIIAKPFEKKTQVTGIPKDVEYVVRSIAFTHDNYTFIKFEDNRIVPIKGLVPVTIGKKSTFNSLKED